LVYYFKLGIDPTQDIIEISTV